MDVLIAGGGIGGLTLGVALSRRGHTVRVLERATTLAPAGAGLALQPNAMTVLATLGLADAVMADGCPVSRAAILDSHGSALGPEMNMAALSAPFGVPVLAIHRARLHGVLRAALGEPALMLGADVTEIEMSNADAAVHCRDGRVLRADLVVGADGLRSLARHMVVGADDPIYSGYTSWRGVTTGGAAPHLTRMSESWGAGELPAWSTSATARSTGSRWRMRRRAVLMVPRIPSCLRDLDAGMSRFVRCSRRHRQSASFVRISAIDAP
ncbi:MAG: FAD-dependent monooxygenase [Vicinamibacterales bacterium]